MFVIFSVPAGFATYNMDLTNPNYQRTLPQLPRLTFIGKTERSRTTVCHSGSRENSELRSPTSHVLLDHHGWLSIRGNTISPLGSSSRRERISSGHRAAPLHEPFQYGRACYLRGSGRTTH